MVTLRDHAKKLAYGSGGMGAYHNWQNAQTLTVLMFHRVLPAAEIAVSGADPLYTVTPEFLADCVRFLRDHYAIVGIDDVLQSQAHAKPLPSRAALITFDDGWYDNLQYGAPVLAGVPWTVFVAAGALEAEIWWQEVLLWAVRSRTATRAELLLRAGQDAPRPDCDPDHDLLQRYAALTSEERDAALQPYRDMLCKTNGGRRMMLAPADLETLSKAGATIGAHGFSHLPLTLLRHADVEEELRKTHDLLAVWTDGAVAPALSFPHGRYNTKTLAAARSAGYSLAFTSDALLNACDAGWLASDRLGRIPIDMHDVENGRGGVDASRLAAWLFLRERRALVEEQ